MGLWGSISSFCGSVASAISSACSAIGGALSSFSSSVAPMLGAITTVLSVVGEALGKFAQGFLQGLGILKENERPEDFGDRAIQASHKGITIEKFENFEDYMNALRDFKPDIELSKKTSYAEKLVAGLGLGTVGVEDKFGLDRGSLNGMWFLPMTNPEYFTVDKMIDLVSAGRLGGDPFAYLEKRLNGADARNFEKSLEVNSDGTSMNDSALESLHGALDSAQERWAELSAQIQEKS